MSGNRERIETIALKAAQRTGLKSLSFRTLATEIGIKSSSVHYHFPEKADLARTLIQRYKDQFDAALQKIACDQPTLRGQLDAFIDIFETVAIDGRLCLCGMMAAELDQLEPAERQQLVDYFSQAELWLQQRFDNERQSVLVALPSPVLAACLLAGLEGALLLDRLWERNLRLEAMRAVCHSWVSNPAGGTETS